MSGGGVSDMGLYMFEDWARIIRPHNPLLADVMFDMYKVIRAYDYWLAGDCGTDRVDKEWSGFRDKWLAEDSPQIEESLRQAMEDIIRSWKTGSMRGRW